ncbi:hypothetical protein HPB48_016805 [Haemaphysalis longicornis]|uniref:Uncharacterized protein n=1 Tax=Haemaphysalis longicornis TaxID=44386 RepID=A0A9J6GT35_HAELO|nr:hypothetical protein HPB48_016805 [Haemaphysalis longicornis]
MAGAAKITPFEVNVRAMKGMQSFGKGATTLADFFAAMNISHRCLHHKTYQGLMGKACNAVASECEAAFPSSENFMPSWGTHPETLTSHLTTPG